MGVPPLRVQRTCDAIQLRLGRSRHVCLRLSARLDDHAGHVLLQQVEQRAAALHVVRPTIWHGTARHGTQGTGEAMGACAILRSIIMASLTNTPCGERLWEKQVCGGAVCTHRDC